jgi:hypothetical protein
MVTGEETYHGGETGDKRKPDDRRKAERNQASAGKAVHWRVYPKNPLGGLADVKDPG